MNNVQLTWSQAKKLPKQIKHLFTKTVKIYPADAREILGTSSGNRAIGVGHVKRLAKDITAGQFLLSNDAICFAPDGRLWNGHHRLEACILADKPIQVQVTFNISRESMPVSNRGKAWTVKNYLQFDDYTVAKRHVGIAKAMTFSFGTTTAYADWSVNEWVEFTKKHFSAVDFVVNSFPGRTPGITSPVMAPIALAYYREDSSELQSFANILCGQLMPNSKLASDVTAFNFRNTLLRLNTGRSRMTQLSLFRKSCAALLAFVQDRELTKIQEIERCPWALPTNEELQAFSPDAQAG